MSWVLLSLRKQSLKSDINSAQFQDIQLSRQLRSVQRHLSYEQSVYNTDKTKELKDIKEEYNQVRKNNPGHESDQYEDWKTSYAEAQEDYQSAKQDIEDYYDDLLSELEDEAASEENFVQEQITDLETQMQAMNAELDTVSEQIKTDISNSAIKLS